MKTRREFIQHGLIACGVLAVGGCRTRQSIHTSFGPDALRKLQSTFEGQLIRPDDAHYDATRRLINHNASTDKRPAIIARCAGQDDVARAIEFARQHDLPLAVRSGGHSFTGWSTCDRGIVIDTRSMREIIVDPIEQTIRTGGGVLSGDVTAAAGEHGLAAVIGQCPTVGVAGLTLGGGLGWLSGRFGATCDNLVSTQIVTADGLALEASAKEKPRPVLGGPWRRRQLRRRHLAYASIACNQPRDRRRTVLSHGRCTRGASRLWRDHGTGIG